MGKRNQTGTQMSENRNGDPTSNLQSANETPDINIRLKRESITNSLILQQVQ